MIPELEKKYNLLVGEEAHALEMKNSAFADYSQITERVKNSLEIFKKIEYFVGKKTCGHYNRKDCGI